MDRRERKTSRISGLRFESAGLFWFRVCVGFIIGAAVLCAEETSPRGGAVEVVGERAYLAAGPAGLKVFDISSSAKPRLVAIDVGGLHPWAVQVSGAYAYVSASQQGLAVYDISQPDRLRPVAARPTDGGFFGTRGLHVMQDCAYVADESSGHVVLFDVRDPLQPREIQRIEVAAARWCQRAGSMLYVAGEEKLSILDMANPAAPRTIGELELNGMVDDMLVVNGCAYLTGILPRPEAGEISSFLIVDVSNPAQPRRMGNLSADAMPAGQRLDVAGTHAYLVGAQQGLLVVDVSQPHRPSVQGHLAIPGASGVQVLDHRVYVSWVDREANSAGLDVVDVSDPASPVRLGGGGEPAKIAEHRWGVARNMALTAAGLLGAVLAIAAVSILPATLLLHLHRRVAKGTRLRHPYLECLALNLALAAGTVFLVFRRTLGGDYVEIETAMVFMIASAVVLMGFPLGAIMAAYLDQRRRRPMSMIAGRPMVFLVAWMTAIVAGAKAESANWLTIFDEQFADHPAQRFKMLPAPEPGTTHSEGSGRYDEKLRAYSLGGHLSLVRPVRAGAHVELSLTLRFEPPGRDTPPRLETDLMLVLFDRTMAGVQLQRSTNKDAPTILRFIHEKPGPAQPKVLREIRMPGAPPDGSWLLRYRHGLLTLIQGTNLLGNADLELLGVPVAGVSWIQKGGTVLCRQMTLQGEPLREVPDADRDTLQRASRLNEEAKALLRNGRTDDALAKMEEASSLFVRVRGESHHDSANSFANRASILESSGHWKEARKLWARALAIHEAVLGPTHPHTTLTRFNLGKNFFKQGNPAEAKELWARCRDDWTAVLGPEYPLVKSLDSLLPRL
ncbi:MAG TPA: tetratricopeptide repeat protein [Candidatus Paceibacterota bacterium]|nr:tetratricopeptide repeat protein [Verrucomicrobiota bacterium]HRZ45879.1 tetratricopeptide repeat protein [Candidatus Paceibacterota bacterium]